MSKQNNRFFEALREKEEEVARFLFTYFYRHVFKAAYFITQDVQLAEDVVQETFFKALGKLRQLDDETKINAWLSKIAINTARSLMRKNRRFPVNPDADVVYRQASEYLPEEVLVQKEDLLAIWQTVDNLPAESQQVFILHYNHGMTIKEISLVTGVPEGTVKSRLNRSRLFLRRKLLGRKGPGTAGEKPDFDQSPQEIGRGWGQS